VTRPRAARSGGQGRNITIATPSTRRQDRGPHASTRTDL